MSANDNGHASLRMEARAWLVKLRGGEVSAELLSDFESWCAESSANFAAYEREVADYRSMSGIKTLEEFGSDGDWRKSSGMGWLKIGAVAAAIVAVLFVVLAGTRTNFPAQYDASPAAVALEPFSTQRGEIRMFQLSDGSVATLDTNSKVEVSITDERRFLRLSQGRARIDVAEGQHPFTAQAGAGEIVASSGSFDVAYDGEQRVSVLLLEGEAFIRPSAQFASLNSSRKELRPNALFAYRADDFSKVADNAVRQSPKTRDWPSGWVEYETIRLDHVISQANNYAAKPIRLADPSLGSLQISGRFRISDTNGFISRICDLFDLRAVAESDATYLRKP